MIFSAIVPLFSHAGAGGGKGVVGIEIPNRNRETVFLREIFNCEEFHKHKMKLPMALGKDIAGLPVVTGMRYGTPSCAEAVRKVLELGIDDLFVMPQYPHYAMSSYETVVVKVQEELARLAPGLKYHVLQPYFNDPAYIDCLVESARPWLAKPFDKVLFSYHGVPERHRHTRTGLSCRATTHRVHDDHQGSGLS